MTRRTHIAIITLCGTAGLVLLFLSAQAPDKSQLSPYEAYISEQTERHPQAAEYYRGQLAEYRSMTPGTRAVYDQQVLKTREVKSEEQLRQEIGRKLERAQSDVCASNPALC